MIEVTGTPAQRARAVAELFPERRSALAARLASNPPTLDRSRRRWVDEAWRQLQDALPDSAEYLVATADAVGVDPMVLMASVHRSFLEGLPPDDGCSVVAGTHEQVGAYLVKNRDNPPADRLDHTVLVHRDPAWGGRRVLAVGSVGPFMASSSGVNTAGFALADTAIAIGGAEPGILRYFLMDALLARCTGVAEARGMIDSFTHLGGTLTMIDADGSVAAADLAQRHVTVEAAPEVGRTNHFVGPGADEESTDADRRANSVCRRRHVDDVLAWKRHELDWDELDRRLVDEFSSHDGDGALCRHSPESTTNSLAVYTANPVTASLFTGPPCEAERVDWSPRERPSLPSDP